MVQTRQARRRQRNNWSMCRICETLWTISGVCCLCYLMLQPHMMLDAHRGHHPQPPKAVPHDLSPLEAMLTTTEALAKARGWPSRAARDALARGLEVRDGRPRPRRFEKGEGPLCAVLMWTATFVLEIAKFRVFEPFVAELDAQVPSINMSALVDWTELGQAHTLLHVFAEHPSQILRGGAVATIPDGDATRTLGERVYRNVGRVRAAERAKRKLKRQETKAFCDTLNRSAAVWKSKFHGAFVLNRRVVLHAIDATTAASSPRNDLVKSYQVHPTHWLISTQVTLAKAAARSSTLKEEPTATRAPTRKL